MGPTQTSTTRLPAVRLMNGRGDGVYTALTGCGGTTSCPAGSSLGLACRHVTCQQQHGAGCCLSSTWTCHHSEQVCMQIHPAGLFTPVHRPALLGPSHKRCAQACCFIKGCRKHTCTHVAKSHGRIIPTRMSIWGPRQHSHCSGCKS